MYEAKTHLRWFISVTTLGLLPQDSAGSSEMWHEVIVTVVRWFFIGMMIFGGIFPYVPQYMEIKKTRSVEGFSTYVCLTLLVANILRIFFWFGKHYETPLLAQSIIMVMTMLTLMHLCVKVRNATAIDPHQPPLKKRFLDFKPKSFWNWTDFSSYLQFLLTLCTAVGALTVLLIDRFWFIESIGFLAVFMEAMLGLPQFLKNYSKKSTVGMSLLMVLMWTSGDIFKTSYFIVREAPLQFVICGILQVTLDITIFGQYLFYDKFHNLRTS